jgi:hypothetical protein
MDSTAISNEFILMTEKADRNSNNRKQLRGVGWLATS